MVLSHLGFKKKVSFFYFDSSDFSTHFFYFDTRFTSSQIGFDCVCNLSHISNVACFTLMCAGEDSSWLFLIQGSLQYSFFMAQWEEYYTGKYNIYVYYSVDENLFCLKNAQLFFYSIVILILSIGILPHAAGNYCGVTEVIQHYILLSIRIKNTITDSIILHSQCCRSLFYHSSVCI